MGFLATILHGFLPLHHTPACSSTCSQLDMHNASTFQFEFIGVVLVHVQQGDGVQAGGRARAGLHFSGQAQPAGRAASEDSQHDQRVLQGTRGDSCLVINRIITQRLIGSCWDLASPSRGRSMAAFDCSLPIGSNSMHYYD